ncbi:MAG: alpha-amylase [Cyanothece sp. SIO2G6]|nr:alpha-amylase [Cyanothece sp. SIO2G6]
MRSLMYGIIISFSLFLLIINCSLVNHPAFALPNHNLDVLDSPTIPSSNGTPEWATRVVWYQIFPERFRNGDLSNDPTLADIQAAYPYDDREPWQIHPWTSDWYKLQSYEQANGQGLEFNLARRRYGGDLQGILDQLDYLESLGVTAIYLNPVFHAPSQHKYDLISFHHVDPTFGPDPVGDRQLIAAETPDDPHTWAWTAADRLLLDLIQQVHQRGMYLILDGVFSHIGRSSQFFQDVVLNQQASIYKDWFEIYEWADPIIGSRLRYRSWVGVPELPEFLWIEGGLSPGPRDYIFAATSRWLDPDGDGNLDDGIDGWRLDVASGLPHEFWQSWHQLVKGINPEALLIAELYGPVEAIRTYVEGDEFDTIMNYPFALISSERWFEQEHPLSWYEFDQQLSAWRKGLPEGAIATAQNLFSSHDAQRLASHIVNRRTENMRLRRDDWDLVMAKLHQDPDYDTRKPSETEIALQKQFVIFQMTYPGAPMVYYGDEVGMWGGNAPDNRKPMLWLDLNYEAEAHLPDGTKRTVPDSVAINRDLLAHYRQLIAIHNTYPALQMGDYDTILLDEAKDIYVFRRRYQDQTIFVALNHGSSPQQVDWLCDRTGTLVDVLNDNQLFNPEQGQVSLSIDPHWGRILLQY